MLGKEKKTQNQSEPTERDSQVDVAASVLKYPKWHYVVIVLAAFMLNFTACGILFSFGVYQATYESLASKPHNPFSEASSADIDLIGTLAASLMTICAPFVMAGAKTYKPQPVVCAGGLLFGIANVLASFGDKIWHFQLAQGLLLGIATGMALIPSLVVPPTWFDNRRGLAMGIVSAGTGIGGLIWVPVTSAAVEHLGFRNSLRLIGCIGSGLVFLSGTVLRWEPGMANTLHDENRDIARLKRLFMIPHPGWTVIKQRTFLAQALCTMFQSAAYYTPVFFTATYAESLGMGYQGGINLTAVSNACNAIGKVAAGLVADRIGRVNAFLMTIVISAASGLGLWVPSTVVASAHERLSQNLFIAFTVLYGLSASAFVSLFSPVLAEVFGMQELPRIAGIMYLLQGSSALVGTPVAGLLVSGLEPGGYLGMAALVGCLMFAAAIAICWLRVEVSMTSSKGLGWRV